MGLERYWKVLTRGERLVMVTTLVLLGALLITGAVLLAGTPFSEAQRTPSGGQVADTDGDGLSDDHEDLRFGTNPQSADTDGDEMPDGWEAENSRVNPLTSLISPDPTRADASADPDRDGLPHMAEFTNGTDPWDPDTDGDGLQDGWEIDSGHDPLDASSATLDLDGDGLLAEDEHELGTLDNQVDSDDDGLTDVEELDGQATIAGQRYTFEATDPARTSTGGSGLPDGFAVVFDLDPHDANVGRQDMDGDGLSSALEAQYSIDRAGSARDALSGGLDPTQRDTDGDGLPDGWEVTHDLDPLDPADGAGDPDQDGLGNGDELFWGTDPLNADTDGDGLPDGDEVNGWAIQLNGREIRVSSNPLLVDSDNDGLTDLEEFEGTTEQEGETLTFPRTHPLLPDSDGDRLQDGFEIRTDFLGMRLNATAADSDGDGLKDAEELEYWENRQVEAESTFPEHLEAPAPAECTDEASAAIQARDPALFGPAGDPDGDCLPNILDPDSDRNGNETLPVSVQSNLLLDGEEIDPKEEQGELRELTPSDPAIADTDGDGLPDEWELANPFTGFDASGRPVWLLDPRNADSDGDGVPDGDDDYEGKFDQVEGLQACWSRVLPDGDPNEDAVGDSRPWANRAYTNADEMTANTDPFRCDTDRDGLIDGWEAANRQHASIDPLTPLSEPWAGTYVQTVCYPGTNSDAQLPVESDLVANDVEDIVSILESMDDAPATGEQASQPEANNVWLVRTGGCNWNEATQMAEPGTRCPFCSIAGITFNLYWAQAAQSDPGVNPSTAGPVDSDGDGAGDAWEALWLAIGQNTTDTRNLVDPGSDQGDPDTDELDMGDEFRLGASPLVRDTDGDGEIDGSDQDPLSPETNAVRIRDADGDHLLDGACDGGVFTPGNDADRLATARQRAILEPSTGTFLCEPSADPNGETTDADGDGIPDAWEMLHSYRESPSNPNLAVFSASADFEADGVRDSAEYALGMPSTWPSDQVWWFGSDPRTASGLDADGDGLSEALGLDPDPYAHLPSQPTPANAWDLACNELGITCPPATPLEWTGQAGQSAFNVELNQAGKAADPSDIVWKGDAILLDIEVTHNGDPASNVPVAIVAMTSSESSRLVNDGELSLLSDQARVACILITDSQGRIQTTGCDLDSTSTSTNLAGTGRTWFGSAQPNWDRSLTPLNPLASSQAAPENNPAIVAWAMGDGEDVGAVDRRQVFVKANTTIELDTPPSAGSAGESVEFTGTVLDAATDPVTQGSLEVQGPEGTETYRLGDQGTFTAPVALPDVDRATPVTIQFSYTAPAGERGKLISSELAHDLNVLPVPGLEFIDKPASLTAGERVKITVEATDTQGNGIQGPLQVSLAGHTVNRTTDLDGRATVSLDVPRDIQPGPKDLVAQFLGTNDFGPATEASEITVRQRLLVDISNPELILGRPSTFTINVEDLGGATPDEDLDVTIRLGGLADATTMEGRSGVTGISLPVSGAIGPATVEVSVFGSQRYEPTNTTAPVTIHSETILSAQPTRVPRGTPTELDLTLVDAMDRPVPEARVALQAPGFQTTAEIAQGQARLPIELPADQPAGPLTVTYETAGPGILSSKGNLNLIVQAASNLTAQATVEPAAGVVNMEMSLVDDQGEPIPNQPIEVNWPLGEARTVRTDGEGSASLTLEVPEDTQPGEHAIQARFDGTREHTPAEAFVTVQIRSPTQIETSGELVWVRGQSLSIQGRVTSHDTGQPVNLPIQVLANDEVLATTRARGSFDVNIPSDAIASLATSSQRFALTVATPGDDAWAPSETTVLVAPLVPVELSVGIERGGQGVTLTLEASTPDGPLQNAVVAVASLDGPAITKETDDQGRAVIQFQGEPSQLVARYRGDASHAPAEATVNLAETAAQPPGGLTWVILTAAVLLIAVDAWILHRVIQRLRVGRQIEEVLEDLERQLMLGDELQAAIYRAYLRMRAIAEVLGEPEQETDTVREFGHRFVDSLDLDDEAVMGLIELFERAWYNQVTPDMRGQAITELQRIQTHLRDRGLVA